MSESREHLRGRQQLIERLIVEYAGAVPPGRVVATVLRADHRLTPKVVEGSGRLATVETIARRQLAEATARGLAPATGASAEQPTPQPT